MIFASGNFCRQAQRYHARAGSHDREWLIVDGRRLIESKKLNQFLRLRSRNERAFVAKKNIPAKLDRAEQMLERLVLSPPSDQFADWRQFRFGQIALEFQVNIEPFPPERMRQQMLGIQARIFNPVFLEIRGRRLQTTSSTVILSSEPATSRDLCAN